MHLFYGRPLYLKPNPTFVLNLSRGPHIGSVFFLQRCGFATFAALNSVPCQHLIYTNGLYRIATSGRYASGFAISPLRLQELPTYDRCLLQRSYWISGPPSKMPLSWCTSVSPNFSHLVSTVATLERLVKSIFRFFL
jgi:hypothetical protein